MHGTDPQRGHVLECIGMYWHVLAPCQQVQQTKKTSRSSILSLHTPLSNPQPLQLTPVRGILLRRNLPEASASSSTLMPLSAHPHTCATSPAVAPAHVRPRVDLPPPCPKRHSAPSFVKTPSSMADLIAAVSWMERTRRMNSSGEGPPPCFSFRGVGLTWKSPSAMRWSSNVTRML